MSGLTGIKQIFFGSLTNNNNTAPKKELNNYSFLNHPIHDTISFQKSHRHYTKAQKNIMQTLKELAVKLGLPDFYTGKPFGGGYKPTIEHIIPHSQKEKAAQKGLESINDLGNFVPVGSRINTKRDLIDLKEWYKMHPDYLENGKKALREYEKINTPEIDGKSWVQKLKKLINGELGYVAFAGRKNPNNLKDQNEFSLPKRQSPFSGFTPASRQKLSYVA